MARNEEKANSMLYRFHKAHIIKAKNAAENPLLQDPATCDSVGVALQTRRTLLKDISRKISRIHDEDLEEESIRSLNDELNRLVKMVKIWNNCLLRLGYQERDKSFRWGDERHPEPDNIHGYYYFGRARQLPGVPELANPPPRVTPTLVSPLVEYMQKNADEEYFGVLEPAEEAELREREGALEQEFVMCDVPRIDWVTGLPVRLPPVDRASLTEADFEDCHQILPTAAEIEAFLIQEKKAELLQKYAKLNQGK